MSGGTTQSCLSSLLTNMPMHYLHVALYFLFVCRGHTNDVLHLTSIPEADQAVEPETPTERPGLTKLFTLSRLISSSYSTTFVDPGSPLTGQTGVFFASSSADGTVRLWNAKTFTCVHIFAARPVVIGPPIPVLACALAPTYTVSGNLDGSIAVHQTEDVLRNAEGGNRTGPTSPTVAGMMAADPAAEAIPRLEREFERALRMFTRIK